MNACRNEFDLNLNGDTFNALKSDFNMVLRKTLSNMELKESEEAELTVKLKIKLKKEKERNTFIDNAPPREMTLPHFDHKVSSVMQIKSELTGSLGGNYELVWDRERGEYALWEITNEQQSLFDARYEQVNKPNDDVIIGDKEMERDNPPAIPGAQVAGLLSGPVNNEVGIGEKYETCRRSFPDCRCMTCAKYDGDDAVSCCSQHARDCKDMVECIDYEKPADPYAYEEPGEGEEDE